MTQTNVPAAQSDAPTAESAECACCTSRRGMLRGAAAAGVIGAAGLALAACSSSGSGSASGSGGSSTTSAATDSGASSSAGSGSGSAANALGPASDVPVGSGKIFTSAKVVVTQPAAGEYKGFSAVCPHAGCTVSSISGGIISCPCHGSQFKIADGSVAQGPATTGLSPVKVTVANGQIETA